MQKTVVDFFRWIFPLNKQQRMNIAALRPYLEQDELSYCRYLLKLRKIGVSYEHLGVNKTYVKKQSFPKIHKGEPGLAKTIQPWNAKIKEQAKRKAFEEFATKSDVIPKLIAPHIIGFDDVKHAACWQLFSPDQVHILLLGDPGTGKTEILRSAAQLAPLSSFGLGSGTSGVGLSAAKKGKELVKGLLPKAHKGLCCIDELNLMKAKDRGALLNAMEKGFITYDKGSTHKKLLAKINVLATANPKGDRFIGTKINFLRDQLPFDPALISRFHLVFLYRRPSKQEFLKITKSLINKKQETLRTEDVEFIREYISFAKKQKVAFDKSLEPVITDFFEDLKEKEDDFLIELSPRLVLGVVRLAKAKARMALKETVEHDDLVEVLRVIKKSLEITKDRRSRR